MSESAQHLQQRWAAVLDGAGQAIDWIDGVRASAPRLDNEADGLILDLRRVRNQARRLGAVSALPMTVGFFGLSQAGKSYLISTLAAGENGKLETDLGGRRLDFLTHINPPGGGKEATGLVTRFTHGAGGSADGDFPLELKLFSEIELVKVLANSFFNDFNQEKMQYRIDDAALAQRLDELGKRRRAQPVAGVGADDVVDLWDYLKGSFPGSLGGLDGWYWPLAVELAPYLALEERARLFGIFWGDIAELTSAYLDFARTLARLGNAARVAAPLDVLVRDVGGRLSQADSIMNVDMLERLGSTDDLTARVRPWLGGELGAAVDLPLAQLAALTAELVFPLREDTPDPLFNEVDLLDFPGYRGRLAVESLDDVRRAVSREEASPVAQLILRGKVAYLFERYTDSQEMNVLVVCTPSNKQSDVTSVGPVLTRWIEKTQGASIHARALRKPGLLWAITMFDMRIASDLDKGEDMLRIGWGNGGMMKMCMLERFGQYDWLQAWTENAPFANTFLVRKPRMKVAFMELDGENRELSIHSGAKASLDLMRKTFCEDDTVRRHVAQPQAAWDAMLELNDGGMRRVSDYLRQVARREVKLQRIGEQLQETLDDLNTQLGRWFRADGAGAVEKKRQIAKLISDAIWPRRVLFGELLARMQVPEDLLRSLYLRTRESEAAAAAPVPAAGALDLGDDALEADDGFDLFGDAPAAPPVSSRAAPKVLGSDAQFAQAVLREWINHLRHLPGDQRLLTFLNFDKHAIEALVDELIIAANRLGLQEQLLRAIASTEQTGIRREQLAGRQVLTARAVLGDFTGWLGVAEQPPDARPASRVVAGARLFQPPEEIAEGALPVLPETPPDAIRQYVGDWLVALARLAEDNAGHSAGLDITPQQNDHLGRILAILSEAPLA